jgi:hypothetical protein
VIAFTAALPLLVSCSGGDGENTHGRDFCSTWRSFETEFVDAESQQFDPSGSFTIGDLRARAEARLRYLSLLPPSGDSTVDESVRTLLRRSQSALDQTRDLISGTFGDVATYGLIYGPEDGRSLTVISDYLVSHCGLG